MGEIYFGILARLEKILGFSVIISRVIGQWAVLFVVLLMVMGVFFRFVLELPLLFHPEYAQYGLLVIGLVGAGYALRTGSHIRIDIVPKMLSPRARLWLLTVVDTIGIVVVGIWLYFAWDMAYHNLVTKTKALTALETPLGIVQMLMVLGCILLVWSMIAELIGRMLSARKPA